MARLIEFFRGNLLESFHDGDIAVVDSFGRRIAACGDAGRTVFLRSAAKPFQAMPLITTGASKDFNLSLPELAVACGSHAGSDRHREMASSILRKIHLTEEELLCGAHTPFDAPTAQEMIRRNEQSTALRNNCSGKHSGMLAVAKKLWGQARSPSGWNYLAPESEVQQLILQTFARFCDVRPESVVIGIDGCSAPNFAVPLEKAAYAAARLFEPQGLSEADATAARMIVHAMTSESFFVAGAGRFDTVLMEVGKGRWCSKIGAEGYQLIALRPGVIGDAAVGITFKIYDGDPQGRAAQRVAVETLRQLGALTSEDQAALAQFSSTELTNWRKIPVGKVTPAFSLERVQ